MCLSEEHKAKAKAMAKNGMEVAVVEAVDNATSIVETEQSVLTRKNAKAFIHIHGTWYDMSVFAPYHPGGDIIYEFSGRDATEVFTAFHLHHDKILRRVKKLDGNPPEKYIIDKELEASSSASSSPAAVTISESSNTTIKKKKNLSDKTFTKDFEALIQQMRQDGLFQPSMFFLTHRIALVVVFFSIGWYLVFQATAIARLHKDDALIEWSTLSLASMMIALFFQQSGFLMHDFMHNQWFQSRNIDQAFGRFFGAVCIGLSSLWWRDEHFVHHVFTNTYDDDEKTIIDVQLAQDLWAQDSSLLQFFDGSLPGKKRKLYFLPMSVVEKILQAQAFLFLPLTVVLGRINIIIASFIKYPNTTDRILQITHVLWFCAMLKASFPSIQSAALFHLLISIGQGVLHVQLLVNHYVKPWNRLEDMKQSDSWYKQQILTTTNIAPMLSTGWLRRKWSQSYPLLDAWDENLAPWFDDWFQGGLNLHIEHHTLPTLPRSSFREANRRIKALCRKHQVDFDERHFFEVVWDTLAQLHDVGQMAKFVKDGHAFKHL